MIAQCIEYFLHLDKYLGQLIEVCGMWTQGVLFLVVFCETGLVVTPFLPGDSLLFAAGALTATTSLKLGLMLVLLTVAAIAGDAVNYAIGKYAGEKIMRSKSRLIKSEHIKRTNTFFEKHGKMTIILARFVPIVRTFAPFLAGMGKMKYSHFAIYNVTGAVLWVFSFIIAGRLFGNLPVVKEYFSLVILAIVILSVLPIVFELWRAKRACRVARESTPPAVSTGIDSRCPSLGIVAVVPKITGQVCTEKVLKDTRS